MCSGEPQHKYLGVSSRVLHEKSPVGAVTAKPSELLNSPPAVRRTSRVHNNAWWLGVDGVPCHRFHYNRVYFLMEEGYYNEIDVCREPSPVV
eukprot:gene13420-biopygen3634